MSKYHYVYKSYEEWGREYIGVRSCNCLPEKDTKYFGSFYDKTFFPTEKTILFVCETREEAMEIEIELHDFFDVAVNPQFANQAKQTSTKFDTTGVIAGPHTKEWKQAQSERMSGENNPRFGVSLTEEEKKKMSEARSGEKNPRFGIPCTEETKKKISVANSGRYLGALSPRSKAIIAIQPDDIQRHFGSGREAARELEMDWGTLRYFLKNGHVLAKGKWKDWRFIYKNSEVLN